MPQAESEHTPSPSRRDVIKSGGKVAAGAVIGAAVAGAAAAMPLHLDAELLAAFERWVALEGSLTAALSKRVSDDEFSAACGAADDVARQIASLRATSIAGLAAKVFLAAHQRYGGTYDNPLEINLPPAFQYAADDERSVLMQRSLLADAVPLLPMCLLS